MERRGEGRGGEESRKEPRKGRGRREENRTNNEEMKKMEVCLRCPLLEAELIPVKRAVRAPVVLECFKASRE
jgi:hypothetical protein